MEIPDGFAQANWKFGGVGAPTGAECTLGLDIGSYGGSAADAAQDCLDAWVDNLLQGQSDEIELIACLVKFGPSATGPSAEVAGGGVGGVSGVSEVPNAAILVSKNTALGGRAGRGRMFIPGAGQGLFNSSGEMEPGDPAIYDGFLADFGNDLVADLLVPVLLHGDSSPITTPTVITSFSVDGTAATQRRRLRR